MLPGGQNWHQLEHQIASIPGPRVHGMGRANNFTCSWTSSFLPHKRSQARSFRCFLFALELSFNPRDFITIIYKLFNSFPIRDAAWYLIYSKYGKTCKQIAVVIRLPDYFLTHTGRNICHSCVGIIALS